MVAIVARCALAPVGTVQYVTAPAKVAERLAGMSEADILSGYAPGIPPISEFMPCPRTGHE